MYHNFKVVPAQCTTVKISQILPVSLVVGTAQVREEALLRGHIHHGLPSADRQTGNFNIWLEIRYIIAIFPVKVCFLNREQIVAF